MEEKVAIDEYLEKIRKDIKAKEGRILFLEEELRILQKEKFANEQLQLMQRQLDKMAADYYRGFPITDKEEVAVQQWMSKHERKRHGLKSSHDIIKANGVSGGRYSYVFYPTAIGTSAEIRCYCGAKYQFRDFE